jgi:hypothetical protein
VRVYAGVGTRAGREVGFFVKLDEANMTPEGVVIPDKYGLATYAHHWRKLWTIDHRPERYREPLYQFMLRQMPGAYEELDASEPTSAPTRLSKEEFVEAVVSRMEDDPRWKQYFTDCHPYSVLAALDMVEEFEANCCNSNASAEGYAAEMVSFFTDGPMPFAVQAALAKNLAAFKQRIMAAPLDRQ